MEKEKIFTTRVIAEMAIMVGLGFALDIFQSGLWRGVFVNGGSIGLSMIPILALSYRRGFKVSIIAGFALSLLQMLGGVYAIASSWYLVFLQICLDYLLTYPCIALAGLFYKKFKEAKTKKDKYLLIILGTTVGGLAKFLCHYLAGVIFWSSSCPDGFLGGPAVYSLVYNGSYMLPNIIISIIILVIMYKVKPTLLDVETKEAK